MSENNQITPYEASPDEDIKLPIVAVNAMSIANVERVARFRGRPMVLVKQPFPHYTPLHKEMFDRIAYPILGGVSRSRMSDVFAYLANTAEDLSHNENLILFGLEDRSAGGFEDYYAEGAVSTVWDMDGLDTFDLQTVTPDQCVWRSPYGRVSTRGEKLKFIMDLAGGNEGVYDDIMQSIAPLIMRKKPDGVIWWVGDGANGKSTLMDALWRIFPGQLSSITVKRLVDGRDTPSLNGTLGNIVKESSEGRVEDTEIYKAVGTHENFRVHKFHSQDDIEIQGNLHHIFSANSIPTFNDKGYSARRRTFIVPFNATFESDPTFEERTFTPEFFGKLIQEMCVYAQRIKKQGYRYKWSAVTLAAKADYDADANNAEVYGEHLIKIGCVGFDSFTPVKNHYEQWCGDNGFVPLGITNLRRAIQALGFERLTARDDGGTRKLYRLPNVQSADLQEMGMGHPGFYTTPGFTPEPEPEEKTKVPEFDSTVEPEPEPEAPKPSILKNKW